MATFRAFQASAQSADSVAHTYQVREAVRSVPSAVTEAETSQRGYIFTSDKQYLESYNAAIAAVGKDIDEAATLTANSAFQQRAVANLRALVQERLTILKQRLAAYEQGGRTAAGMAVNSGRGENLMEQIRSEVGSILQEEQRLLSAQRAAESSIKLQTERVILLGSGGLLVFLTGLAAVLYRGFLHPSPDLTSAHDSASQPVWVGYAVALVGVALATGVRWQLARSFGQDLPPFITFYPVIILSALFGGTVAGLIATLLSAGTVSYLFLSPIGSFWVSRPVDMASLALSLLPTS